MFPPFNAAISFLSYKQAVKKRECPKTFIPVVQKQELPFQTMS